jgi:hypothetical protein
MKSVIVNSTAPFRRGKTALAMPGSRQAVHGTVTDQVTVANHTFRVDDTLQIESVLPEQPVTAAIRRIWSANIEQLTADDFRLLGYTTRHEFETDGGELYGPVFWILDVEVQS